MTTHTVHGACIAAVCASVLLAPSAASAELSLPMDDDLVAIKIMFGVGDKEPSSWEGAVSLAGGEIVAADSWRLLGNDYVTTSAFKLETRRFYPRFWNLRGRDPSTFPIEPNGIVLTLANRTADSVLQFKTSQGDFEIPVGTLGYGGYPRTLDRRVEYRRVPAWRRIVEAPTEDAYPAGAVDADGKVAVAYLQFTHGKGFEKRPPVKEAPEDFSFLAAPTGGDRIMFTELIAGTWTEPVPMTPAGGDVFGPAAAVDGQGRVWVLWSANANENWDVFARMRTGATWSEPVRLSSGPGADFGVRTSTDADGRVWAVWQSFANGTSDILTARQNDTVFDAPVAVSAAAGNQWAPAIATSADGQVAVAWDTYERGRYDVAVRTWHGGAWRDPQLVAGSLRNECRPSLAFDPGNRLWIAYEISPRGWGKDFGPYDMSPTRTALYKGREIGLRVLAGDTSYEPAGNVNLAMPRPDGTQRWPKNPEEFLVASPALALAADGRVWLSARVRVNRLDSAVGGTWLTYLTTVDGNKWRSAVDVPGTDGFLHETPALIPSPRSGLYLLSAPDGRQRAAASFGQPKKETRRTTEGLPAIETRVIPKYADWAFNKEIAFAQTGPVATPEAPELVRIDPPVAEAADAEIVDEARQVEAIRAYRTSIRNRDLRIVRGEFHRHTEISSDGAGDGSIFDMWRYGIDMASLDWIGNGDHDNGGGREFSWWLVQKTTSIFNVPGAFASMYTYERSCNYPDGHRNAVFAQRGIRPLGRLYGGKGKAMDDLPANALRPNTPDTQMFYKYLHQFDGICASHTIGTDMGTDWRDNDPKVEPIVEIYQGDRQSYERPGAPRSNVDKWSIGGWRPLGFVSLALQKGYRLGFQSSSDHISTHMSYCNVWVEEPTREAILDGMKKRRVYGATDNIIADVRCGEHFMGEEFTVSEPPKLRVKLIGTAPFDEVVIVKDNEYVYSSSPRKQEVDFEWTDTQAVPGKTSYYYVRGLQVGQTNTRKMGWGKGPRTEVEINNGEVVWVSPMWITYRP